MRPRSRSACERCLHFPSLWQRGVRAEDEPGLAHLGYEGLPKGAQFVGGAFPPQSLWGLPTPGVEILPWKVDQRPSEACIAFPQLSRGKKLNIQSTGSSGVSPL